MIKSDWGPIKRELKRLRGIPSMSDKRKLDRVLRRGLSDAQSIVHIDTSSLYQSGKVDSALYGKIYIGDIEFGGFSGGVNNPVDYAIYELERGGGHNFMRKTPDLHPLWIKAMISILRGSK